MYAFRIYVDHIINTLRGPSLNSASVPFFQGWPKLAQMGQPWSRLRAAGANTFSKTDIPGIQGPKRPITSKFNQMSKKLAQDVLRPPVLPWRRLHASVPWPPGPLIYIYIYIYMD